MYLESGKSTGVLENCCGNCCVMKFIVLISQLMDRYFDTPDAKFDLDIFEEGIDLCIKYNDRHGVGTFWRLMEEMNVEPPDELREKVCHHCWYNSLYWNDSR